MERLALPGRNPLAHVAIALQLDEKIQQLLSKLKHTFLNSPFHKVKGVCSFGRRLYGLQQRRKFVTNRLQRSLDGTRIFASAGSLSWP